jgi:hypothetical protein
MKTKTILGLSLIAAFAISMIVAQNALAVVPPPPNPTSAEVQIDDSEIRAAIYTDAPIPRDGSSAWFGYGILTDDLGGENVLALTSHICAADSFVQNNAPSKICPDEDAIGLLEYLELGSDTAHDGPQWHAHVLDLMEPTSLACDGAAFEVNLGSSLANNLSPGPQDHYIVNVNGDPDRITVKAPLGDNNAAVPGDADDVDVVSYTIGGHATDGAIDALCLFNVQPVPNTTVEILN